LQLIRGNPSKRPVKAAPSLPAAPTVPEPPSYLTGHAIERWREVAPQLHAAGLLAEVDSAILAAHCTSYAMWRTAQEALKTEPLTVAGSMGQPTANPLISIARSAASDMISSGERFGLTPASRSKVSPAEAPRDSKFDGLLGA
jgi:P27 family predicted phage terminase small subunit